MRTILGVTLPFFALVLFGYIAARRRWVPTDAVPAFNGFLLFFAVPAMLFRFAANTPFEEIANGRYRAIDPWHHIKDGIVVRRLSPNNRKIEAETSDFRLHSTKMLKAMGIELANVHCGTDGVAAAVTNDLSTRKPGWLAADTEKATKAVLADYKQFKKG